MGIHNGKIPENAEICLDYIKKKVSFHYPYISKNKNEGYRHNTLYFLSFLILSIPIARHGMLILLMLYVYHDAFFFFNPLTFIFFLLLWFSLFIISFTVLFASSFSYFIHTHSEIARKNYPKTNNILGFAKRRKMIDFKDKYSEKHYIDGNKLIVMDYRISCFEYNLITKNKLKRIYTKSVSQTKKAHYKFVCFFEFSDPITEGYLIYK